MLTAVSPLHGIVMERWCAHQQGIHALRVGLATIPRGAAGRAPRLAPTFDAKGWQCDLLPASLFARRCWQGMPLRRLGPRVQFALSFRTRPAAGRISLP